MSVKQIRVDSRTTSQNQIYEVQIVCLQIACPLPTRARARGLMLIDHEPKFGGVASSCFACHFLCHFASQVLESYSADALDWLRRVAIGNEPLVAKAA